MCVPWAIVYRNYTAHPELWTSYQTRCQHFSSHFSYVTFHLFQKVELLHDLLERGPQESQPETTLTTTSTSPAPLLPITDSLLLLLPPSTLGQHQRIDSGRDSLSEVLHFFLSSGMLTWPHKQIKMFACFCPETEV